MAFNGKLAERIRTAVADEGEFVEKKMFGGLAFMLRGHMVCGVTKDDLMCASALNDMISLWRCRTRAQWISQASL